MMSGYSITFLPLLPGVIIMVFALMLIGLFVLSVRTSASKAFCRLLFGFLIVIFLLQPQLAHENRKHLKDTVLIAVDKSQSQDLGKRSDITSATLGHLQTELKKIPDLDVRTTDVALNAADETKVFDQIETAFSDIPENQRAGTILLSDGQVTDAPSADLIKSAPLHIILTGSKRDKDREIKIINAPGYSVLGETVTLKYRVEDHNVNSKGYAVVQLNLADGSVKTQEVPIGVDQEWPLTINTAGQNVFELSTAGVPDEISTLNNRAVINVQGVRNRLHVLLVSGEPYPGARMWRDLLKADPGVDLVHFTILRSPDKIDATPTQELSLIAFPFQELFERKLKDFDLIIMDRFSLNTMLPDFYFENMKNYVLNGGALLEISGPSFATQASMFLTPLGEILPGEPTGTMIQSPFKPKITDLGKTHPVTMPLTKLPAWGSWLQQIPVRATKGDVLMTGIDNNPLLILNRTGKGRVAQMTSDQMWLWARGYQGGGPTTELLRRTVHWLMKEPELDEQALDIHPDGTTINIRTREVNSDNGLNVIKPDGSTEVLKLSKGEDGWLSGSITNASRGIYKFSDGERQKIIALGDMTTPEFSNIITTDKNLQPFISSSHGVTIWAEDQPNFTVKSVANNSRYGGNDWIGLKQNRSSSLISSEMKPLCRPEILLFLGLISGLLLWWNESRRTKPH